MKSISNTLFLKDLIESSTIEEFVEFSMQRKSESDWMGSELHEKFAKKESLAVYSPSVIRGTGSAREGYCQICKKWYKMKTSSYWYHMNYKHGINSKGEVFPEPIFREFSYKIQGFCKKCDDWIVLGSNKKTSEFLWKRHCQKQHTRTEQKSESDLS